MYKQRAYNINNVDSTLKENEWKHVFMELEISIMCV